MQHSIDEFTTTKERFLKLITNSAPSISEGFYITTAESGEFTITFDNSNGYIDIGLTHKNELSFHIRNDVNPQHSSHGDVAWDGKELPTDLTVAISHLLDVNITSHGSSSEFENPYGGYNDKALLFISRTLSEEDIVLRAHKDTGKINIALKCSDVFDRGGFDVEYLKERHWSEFEEKLHLASDVLQSTGCLDWYTKAWAVKIRGLAPLEPLTKENPSFVQMLDWMKIPWRTMKRHGQINEHKETRVESK